MIPPMHAPSSSHMERHATIRVRDRAADRHAGAFVESILAEHQCGPPPLLFVTRLRIKIQRDEIALLWDVSGHHQTSRPLLLQANSAAL